MVVSFFVIARLLFFCWKDSFFVALEGQSIAPFCLAASRLQGVAHSELVVAKPLTLGFMQTKKGIVLGKRLFTRATHGNIHVGVGAKASLWWGIAFGRAGSKALGRIS